MTNALQTNFPPKDRLKKQVIYPPIFAFVILLIAEVGIFFNERYFMKYYPSPLVTFPIIAILGIASLFVLRNLEDFQIWNRKTFTKGIFRSFLFSFPLGCTVIIADILGRYAETINVPFPNSLAFYPIIGLGVDFLFHLLPLAIICGSYYLLRKKNCSKHGLNVAILMICLFEPLFQAYFGILENDPSGLVIFTSFQVLAINLIQFRQYRKYDFISMYGFRIFYYCIWHIIWGYLRLKILF